MTSNLQSGVPITVNHGLKRTASRVRILKAGSIEFGGVRDGGLPIAVAWGASASSASAVRDGARSSIGTAPVFSIPLEPQPASQATTQPARATVAHNGAATVANRRGFMIPSSPKAPPEPCCTAPAREEVFFGSRHARAMTQTAGHQFF
jgi:hypothetical protein